MTIDSPSTLSKLDLYNEDNPNAEIAAGYIPGSSSCKYQEKYIYMY